MTAQQDMIVNAFNSQVYIQDRMDVQHTPLYDTLRFTPAGGVNPVLNTLTGNWFTNVGPASGKTLAETNMNQQQKLPAPEAFSVYGMRLRIGEDILREDLQALFGGTGGVVNGFALEFYLGQKPYQRAPLWYFAAGGGIWGASDIPATAVAIAVAVPRAIYTNGLPDRNGMHKLILNIVIENQMTFYAQVVGTPYAFLAAAATFGTGAVMQLLLDGLYARGVQ